MATPSTELEVVSGAPAPPPQRPRVLLAGAALASGAASMALLTLVAVYTRLRADVVASGETWLPEGAVIQLTPGNMQFFTLLLSAVTVAWAVRALHDDDRLHAYMALGITLVLGAAFINGAAYFWQQSMLGAADSVPGLLILTITGFHVAMVGAGMLFLAVMAFRALGGQLTGRGAEGMTAAALYWYVTTGAYAVVWYAITVTK
ncbi:MAG: heme-copper oxidase subunit III [Acidimicrobiia bacterium]